MSKICLDNTIRPKKIAKVRRELPMGSCKILHSNNMIIYPAQAWKASWPKWLDFRWFLEL